MAWYCEYCKRYVEGNEVDVGRLGVRRERYENMAYHRLCLQPVRAEKDENRTRFEAREEGSDA